MEKILIAVYSQTGQSMHIAHMLQKKSPADIYEIIPDRKYNDDMSKGAHYITGLPRPRFITGNNKKLENVIDEWVQTIIK